MQSMIVIRGILQGPHKLTLPNAIDFDKNVSCQICNPHIMYASKGSMLEMKCRSFEDVGIFDYVLDDE